MHVDFYAFRDMSNNSSSQTFSKCWRNVTDGAITKMSSAYSEIYRVSHAFGIRKLVSPDYRAVLFM